MASNSRTPSSSPTHNMNTARSPSPSGPYHNQWPGPSSTKPFNTTPSAEGTRLLRFPWTSTFSDDDSAVTPGTGAPGKPRRTLVAWRLEILALLLSTSALLATIVTMASQQGKPLTSWRFFLPLNAVVAILGVVSKGTLAFLLSACLGQQKWNWFRAHRDRLGLFDEYDEASRGPWGSARLLFGVKPSIRNWGVLGALITLTTLIQDPFLQATLSTKSDTRSVAAPARLPTIPAARGIRRGELLPNNSGPMGFIEENVLIDSFTLSTDLGVGSAVYDGFYASAPDTTVRRPGTVSFSCATGNCTWPLFATAAVCATCNDITSSLVRKSWDKCSGQNGTSRDIPINEVPIGPCTSFAAPYGEIKQFDGPYRPGAGTKGSVVLTANFTEDYSGTVSLKEADTTFFTWLVLRAGDDFLKRNVTWEKSSPSATECGLSFCVRGYTASASNGVLTEKPAGKWADRDLASWRVLDRDSNDETGRWADRHKSLARKSKLRSDLQLNIPSDRADKLRIPPDTRFNISQATIEGLQEALTVITQRDVERGFERDGVQLEFPVGQLAAGRFPIADVLGNTDDLTGVFERLADRLTVQFRNADGEPEDGTLEEYVLLFDMRWRFLALPLASLAAGAAYFVAVVAHTRGLGLPVWKESAYPTLTYGFDEKTQALLRSADERASTSKAVRRFRRRMVIGLEDSPDGLRLKAAKH